MPAVDGFSGSLAVAKGILFCFRMRQMKRVVGGLSGSLMVAKIDLKSIPATQSLTVFEGRYWLLQKLHSCAHIVAVSF